MHKGRDIEVTAHANINLMRIGWVMFVDAQVQVLKVAFIHERSFFSSVLDVSMADATCGLCSGELL